MEKVLIISVDNNSIRPNIEQRTGTSCLEDGKVKELLDSGGYAVKSVTSLHQTQQYITFVLVLEHI